jgi:hypothetical protein
MISIRRKIKKESFNIQNEAEEEEEEEAVQNHQATGIRKH